MIIPDDDFDRLMRRADPAITPLDEPLDRDSLAVLNSLMPEGRQLTGTVLSKAQWPWLVIPLTLAALMVVILVVQPWSFLGRPSPAAAAPPMLPITESGASLEQVISESISTLDSSVDGLPRAERHARSEGWFIQLEVGDLNTAPAFITPEESVLTWDERLSGTLTVSAGRSYSPTDPKFLKEAPGIPTPGTILRKETFGPGEAPVLFQVSPMDDPTAMKAYLAKYSGIPDDADASAYLEAVRLLLSEWSLTPRQHASILRILQALGGMHLGGETTDRLGRPAIAIRVAPLQPDGYENLLLLSRDSGEMIALETIYVGGVLELALPVPTVASYVAWK